MKQVAVAEPPEPDPAAAERLLSLDVFRGATIAAMILVNNPGDWGYVYAPLRHAVWHGWTFTDLIFPFFLWIAGLAMTLSFARRVEQGASRARLLLHTVRRAALIFLLGLLLNGFPAYDLAALRIPGVLQRIAVCYLIAAAIFLYSGTRARVLWTAFLLAFYCYLMRDGYEQGANFAEWVDSQFLAGHMWAATKTWDPEGIVSTLPAIATCLLGVLTGQILRARRSAAERAVWMLVSGNALAAAGLMLDPWAPINKNLWTASYALFTAGLAASVFGACFWLIDARGMRWGTAPLAIYGRNAIVVYAMSGVMARALGVWGGKTFLYKNVFEPLASPINASLLYAAANVAALFAVAWAMYRRRWFVRL
ncbi:MAG: acyltransferase family protein [Bryobacteraceae bacterium]